MKSQLLAMHNSSVVLLFCFNSCCTAAWQQHAAIGTQDIAQSAYKNKDRTPWPLSHTDTLKCH